MSGAATFAPVETRARTLRARAVVRAMQRELVRQVREGTLISATMVDHDGRLVVEGQIDLAMLALVTEQVLISEIYG